MSGNNNQDQQKQQNPFDPNQLVKGLSKRNISIPEYGVVYRVTCEQLEAQVEEMFQNRLGFPEMDHAFIYPIIDGRGEEVSEMKCVFYFNTTVPNSSVTRNGSGAGSDGSPVTVLDLVPIKSVKGEFSTNEKFQKTMSTIAVLDGDGNIPIKSVQDKRVACVDVDFWLLMALCLDLDEEQPYNFRILSADAGNMRKNGYENVVLAILKYIDNSRRYRRSNGSGRKIDYRAMDKAMVNSSNGGGRNY